MEEKQLLISPKEVMEMLGFKSYNTVRKLWEDGYIKIIKINGRPKVIKSSVIRYIRRNTE
jgi:hypothetical protein